jgi:hypothetical protein
MVLIMVWRPRGLIATREPSTFLNAPRFSLFGERKTQSAQPSLGRERPG